MPAEEFLEQVDEAGPRPLGCERVVSDAVDLELARVRVGEAVADMAVGVDLPVAAGLGQLLAKATTFSGGTIGSSQPWKATTLALIFSGAGRAGRTGRGS